MVTAIQRQSWRQRISDWIFRSRIPEVAPAILTQRRIFILPTRTGYFFAFVLVLLLIASINYNLSLGFLLTFLLAGVGAISMLHTFRNLARLSVSPGKSDPVFCTEPATFNLVFTNASMPRYAIGIRRTAEKNGPVHFGDVGAADHLTLPIVTRTEKRGFCGCGRIEIFTEYPLGFFHAWSYVDFGMKCLVYPKPNPGDGVLPVDRRAAGEGNIPIRGDEEFQSLRAYQRGDTPRQIAWKALARGQGLLVKEFGATASADLWLDFAQLEGLSVEDRLGRLTWWVMEAERLQVAYGLRLPNRALRPHLGAQHRDECLRALALYGNESP